MFSGGFCDNLIFEQNWDTTFWRYFSLGTWFSGSKGNNISHVYCSDIFICFAVSTKRFTTNGKTSAAVNHTRESLGHYKLLPSKILFDLYLK